MLGFINRLKWLCSIRFDFNGWSWVDIVVPYYNDPAEHKPKHKTNGEQMATLDELFEPDWDAGQDEIMREHAERIMELRQEHDQNVRDEKRSYAESMIGLRQESRIAE